MAKIIDITNKLGFEEKPKMKVLDKEFEINNNAVALLEIMPKLENPSPQDLNDMMNVLFKPEDVEYIKTNLKLNIKDFTNFIMNAINIASGSDEEDEDEGETVTPATT